MTGARGAGGVPLARMPWWTSPAGINLGFLVPMLLLIASVGQLQFDGLTLRGIQFLDAGYICMGLGLLLVTTVSGWIGAQLTSGPDLRPIVSESRWDPGALLAGLIALGADLIFFKTFLIHPGLFLSTLTGAYRPDRTNIELTVGVTSLVNCAPAFFSVYAYRAFVTESRPPPWMHLLGLTLLCLTVLRVYAWSERLALIECVVPFSLAVVHAVERSRHRVLRGFVQAGPLFAMPMLILYFGAAEWFRSWNSSTYHNRTGFWEFAVGRLASYYYTALNNGAGLLATSHWPSFQFEYTLGWLHKAPVIGPVFSAYVNLRYGDLVEFLTKYGDIEFNNPSGLYTVVFDLGLPGAILYFSAMGVLGGALFRSYRRGGSAGVLFYPLFYLAFLEVFRYPYLGVSRAFTWALAVVIVLLSVVADWKGPSERSRA